MQRDLSRLQQDIYDVVIIGGGIYGACIAWDASLRGLTVALVDQGDFGHATSANHHKIIHGGFRYLQHADLPRMRESIRERRILMQIAPHLVSPLPCVIPTYEDLPQRKWVMWAALKLYDLIGFDRNHHLAPQKWLPRSRVISRTDCLQLCPNLDQRGLTGGALFFDAQVYNPDRLTLSFLLSAASRGADLANYAQVTGFLRERDGIAGVQVKDLLSGKFFGVRGRMVVNCSGPWMNRVLQLVGGPTQPKRMSFVKAAVLATRSVIQGCALGVASRSRGEVGGGRESRYFFITPWRNISLIGTLQVRHDGSPEEVAVTEQELRDFLNEVNTAYPAGLTRQDVYFAYSGLVPADDADNQTGGGALTRRYRILDHERDDGIPGLISVLGVKYTTARDVAAKTIDLVFRKLGKCPAECQTHATPIYGGAINGFEELAVLEQQQKSAGISAEAFQHLLQTYGSGYRDVLRYCEEDQEWSQPVTNDSPVIKAEVLHGVRDEMAQKLTDILLRRTELATVGYPGRACLNTCAAIMAREAGWDRRRIVKEIEAAEAILATR